MDRTTFGEAMANKAFYAWAARLKEEEEGDDDDETMIVLLRD